MQLFVCFILVYVLVAMLPLVIACHCLSLLVIACHCLSLTPMHMHTSVGIFALSERSMQDHLISVCALTEASGGLLVTPQVCVCVWVGVCVCGCVCV